MCSPQSPNVDIPWVHDGRSRSPPANVAARVFDLEQRVNALERTVNELQTEKTWWNWWYGHWGRWLQTKVLRLSDVMCSISNAWVEGRAVREQQQKEHPHQHQHGAMQTGDESLGAP